MQAKPFSFRAVNISGGSTNRFFDALTNFIEDISGGLSQEQPTQITSDPR
jgi:hypothetical protein